VLTVNLCRFFISADLLLAVSEPELQVDEGGDGDSCLTFPHTVCVQDRRTPAAVPSYLQL
jgi:hypothetical protein